MTKRAVAATLGADTGFDGRWRAWQARGAAQERRLAARMQLVVGCVVVALAVWILYLQFA
jgi:hypothetical protein